METNINANIGTSLETTHTLDLSDRLYKVAIGFIALVAVATVGWGVYAFSSLPQNIPHEIQVSGEGKAYAKPDIATISFGAHTEAKKSQDAVNENNKIMDGVISAIKGLGVQDKDIQTTMYNVQPTYGYNYPVPMMGASSAKGGTAIAYPMPVRQQVVTGYSLDQQIQVKIRNFDNINGILDAAAKNGANSIGSLQFTVDDIEKVRSEARENAIKQAEEKAKSMFKAAGLRAPKIVNISEGYNNYPQTMYATGIEMKDSESVAPSIQAGQEEINVTVTLTYRVK